jgi:hypothetical protein
MEKHPSPRVHNRLERSTHPHPTPRHPHTPSLLTQPQPTQPHPTPQDNFEWNAGYLMEFGLYAWQPDGSVDRKLKEGAKILVGLLFGGS